MFIFVRDFVTYDMPISECFYHNNISLANMG